MGSFVDSLNQAGAAFCGFTWAMLIQSSVLIAVLYAIDRIIRHKVRAVVRYGVWMLVLVKLILPPTLSLPTGIGYWVSVPAPAQEIRTVESQPVLPVAAKVNSTVNTSSLNAETTPQPFIETSTVTKVQPEIAVPIEAEKVRTLTWHAWMLCAWIAGVIALLGLLFQRLWFVRRLLSQSRPADAAWDELTHACAEQVGLRNPIEVRVSKYLHSPAACGLIRPVILMPKAIEHALSQDRRSAILLHELVHIARADLWVNLIQTLLQVAYFYNPLLWLANAKIRSLREKAVDETVLTKLEDDDAGQYSTTLIDIAEIAFSKPHFSLGLIGVVESKKALAERIKHILGRPMPTSAKVGILGVAAIAVGALVLLPMTKAGTFDWWLHRDRLVAFKSLGNARGSNEQRGRVEHYAKEYEVAIRPHEKLLVFAELYQHGQPMRRLGHKVLDGSSGAQKLSVALEREYLNDEKTKARFSGRVTWGHEVCHFKRSILETQSFFPTDIRGFFQGEEMTRVGDQRFWEGETLMTFVAQPLGGPPRAPNIWMPGYRVSQGLSDGYFILIKMLPLSTLDQLRIQWRRGIDPQLPDGTYLGPDATRAQWQAVADEYVLDIKRMLMRGRMPLPELSVHTKYAFGEPVHIRTTSPFQGAWQPTLENIDPYQYDRRGLMFCLLDNKEYTSRLTVGPFGSGGMNLQLPGRLDAQDLDLSPGMHSVAYGWRHVDVVDPCQPDVSLHFDRLLTNTVEFEVVKALPEDYYRATFQPSWEEVLRHKITIAFTDDMPKYGVSGPLLALIIDRAPFDLAFDIFAQAEGSQEVLPAGSVAVVSGVRRLVPCDHHLESLNWETVGDKRWRLILKPSVHAAKARPPIREFYGREYVTDWATFDRSEQFERHYQTYLRRQGRETDRLGGTLKADRPVDLDRLNRRLRATGPVWPLPEGDELGWSTDNGGTIKIDPDSDVRMLWLSEANGNRIDPAQASVDRLSELAESPLKEIKPPKGERTLIAVRSSEGKVFWVTVRKVNETWADLSWWEHEQTNDGPADMPVAEGVSAEIKIARAALSVGDPVEIDVTLRNTSNEPVTLYCPVIYTARQLSVLKDGRTLAPEETGVMYDVPHPKANFHTLDVGQAHAVQLRGRVSIRTLPMRRGAARTQPTLTLDFGDTAFDLGKPGAFQIQLRLPIGQQETDTGTALGFANLVRGLVASNRIKLTVTQATAAQLRRAIDRLDRGTVQEKKDAMALLAANRDRQAVRAFVEILRAGPGPVFRDAINALVAIGDASVLPELTGMYLQMVDVGQAGGSDHVTSASLVLYLIERLQPPPEALKPFHQKVLLSQVSPWARAEAGVRLARLGDEQAVDALVALMHTGSPATQRLILRNMRWGGGGREMPASATEKLTAAAIDLMRSTAPVAVRREAVKELAMALGDRSVPLLIDALKDKDLWVGLTAAIHLRGRGTSDAIAPLEEFLKRADTDHKRRVARETLDDIRQRSEATQ